MGRMGLGRCSNGLGICNLGKHLLREKEKILESRGKKKDLTFYGL
jgi:hypothetical protein